MTVFLCSNKTASGNAYSPGVAGFTPPQNHASLPLEALWRSRDLVHQLGTLDRQTKKFKNKPVAGVADAVRQALAQSEAGFDVYFACAEYKTTNSREAANAYGAFGFWLDIDCGEDKAAADKGYVTVAYADKEVRRVCSEAGLPNPTHIVYTGGGLHVYWVLDSVVDRQTWQAYARKLKALTHSLGLFADDSRTADIASVLRVPGTLNYKYDPPRPVSLEYASAEFIEKSAMLAAFDRAHGKLCQATSIRRNCCPSIASNAATSTPGTPDRKRLFSQPSTTEPMAEHVHLLQVLLNHIDADSEYDDWLHAGMALHFETSGSDEGLALFDAWSSTGKKYRGPKETEAKWCSFRTDLDRHFSIRTLIWLAELTGCSMQTILAEIEPFETCGGEHGTS